MVSSWRSALLLLPLLPLLCALLLPAPARAATAPVPHPTNPLAVRTDVLTFTADRAGVVTITAAALAAAGWDLAQLDPDHIHAWRDGRQVPLELIRSGGQLQALRLAVAPSASRWTDTATYWLSVEGRPGLRAPVPSAALGWTFDADQIYLSGWPTLRGDRWWSAELPAGVARTLAFELPAAAPAGSVLALPLRTTGAGGQLQLVLDGQALGAPVLPNAQALTLSLTLREALAAGRHTLTLTSSAPDPVLLDHLALPGLAVPLPELPAPLLQAHTPVTPLGGGDTVIITHASLRPALGPLIAAHQALGERVQVVDAQVAYDLYSWGERSPEAIRDSIRFAVARWTPVPQRVLLVGAGTVALHGAPPAGHETPRRHGRELPHPRPDRAGLRRCAARPAGRRGPLDRAIDHHRGLYRWRPRSAQRAVVGCAGLPARQPRWCLAGWLANRHLRRAAPAQQRRRGVLRGGRRRGAADDARGAVLHRAESVGC